MSYQPSPLDLSNVVITDSTRQAIHKIAINVHENWAQQRLNDGWTHGPQRDDKRRTHPCLVPYDALPDEEKHYDILTTETVIKSLLALGYQISHPQE